VLFTISVQNRPQLLSGNKAQMVQSLLTAHTMKELKIISILFIMLAISSTLSAQVTVTKSTEIQIIDGKAYYIHEVLKGHTLYSISKAYEVTVEKIKTTNKLQSDDLQLGYLLKIPVGDNNTGHVVQSNGGNMTTENHVVKKGESLYKIAGAYNTSVENLRRLNPGISENLAEGQILKVPVPVAKEPAVKARIHVVAKGETLYSIAKKYLLTLNELKQLNPDLQTEIVPGQEIIVGFDKIMLNANGVEDTCDCNNPKKLAEYNVALLIPLYLEKSTARTYNTENKDKNEWYQNITFSYIQFYEGMQIALDTLKSAGIKVNLYVYDFDDTEAKFSKTMSSPELKTMNLILGPFQAKYIDTISRFSHENKIPMVSCFLSSLVNLQEINPYYFNPVTSISNQMMGLATYFTEEKKDANLIVAYQASDVEKNAAMALDSFLRANDYPSWSMVNLNESGLKGATAKMSGSKENVLVYLANGDMFIENSIRSLNDLKKTYNITMFGLPGWLNYENLDIEFLEFQNTHFFSSSFIDYEQDDVRDFARTFQKRFKADPDKQAYMGYDIALFFLSALNNYGTDFPSCIDKHNVRTLATELHFVFSDADGFRNSYVAIYRMKDFQLWKVQ